MNRPGRHERASHRLNASLFVGKGGAFPRELHKLGQVIAFKGSPNPAITIVRRGDAVFRHVRMSPLLKT